VRRWNLDHNAPYSLTLAADSQGTTTDPTDDQVWEVKLGTDESAAFALQTTYGGRVGLVSLVPMWFLDGRAIYQLDAYHAAPVITGFAPGYNRLQAALTEHIGLQIETIALDSHALGVLFTLVNGDQKPAAIQLDTIAFIGSGGKELAPLSLDKALSLGNIGNLQPVILQEQATVVGEAPVKPKLSNTYTIPAKGKIRIKLVHVALADVQASLQQSTERLDRDWQPTINHIQKRAENLIDFETGDIDMDATLAFSARELAQGFVTSGRDLPSKTIASTRTALHHSQRANERRWAGQSPMTAYLGALGIASAYPELAHGVIRNYLKTQRSDGYIEARVQPQETAASALCMPILARLSWGMFQYTEDNSFLKEVFPGLLRFFSYWMQRNGEDRLPTWHNEQETGYRFTPTFATWQAWGGGANIVYVESPDLIAYLLSEAISLHEIASYLRDSQQAARLEQQISRLQEKLEQLWHPTWNRYVYRDIDSHATLANQSLVHDARGMERLTLNTELTSPNRLLIRVNGGNDLRPRATFTIEGTDENGEEIQEVLQETSLIWSNGRGVSTTAHVYQRVSTITVEGLSRVYRIDVETVDLTRFDINGVLPLWAPGIPEAHAKVLLSHLTNPEHFWRPSGIAMNSAQDTQFDPANANGSGGVWPFWNTLLGEALIEHQQLEAATEAIYKLMEVQIKALREHNMFREFYHSDQPIGLGDQGHVNGIIPLHLFMRVIGVRIISDHAVWTGGPYYWPTPMTIRQHGVEVQRSRDETRIQFPNGHSVQILNGEWKVIRNA
jgi:hypothetical protein